jgi:hypothetical protein
MNWPLEQEGSTAENVRSVQYLLNASGASLAVAALFARTWQASDGWSFVGSEGAAGHFICTWSRPGGETFCSEATTTRANRSILSRT